MKTTKPTTQPTKQTPPENNKTNNNPPQSQLYLSIFEIIFHPASLKIALSYNKTL